MRSCSHCSSLVTLLIVWHSEKRSMAIKRAVRMFSSRKRELRGGKLRGRSIRKLRRNSPKSLERPRKRKKAYPTCHLQRRRRRAKRETRQVKRKRRAAALPKSHRITLQIIMLHQQERRRHLLRTNFLLGLARPSACKRLRR